MAHNLLAAKPLGAGVWTINPSQDLIARWRAGDEQALKDLLPLVYEELHRVAREHLRRQRADHTLQTTALIHEAYLRKFAGAEGVSVPRTAASTSSRSPHASCVRCWSITTRAASWRQNARGACG